jgi:hypothetical protein
MDFMLAYSIAVLLIEYIYLYDSILTYYVIK